MAFPTSWTRCFPFRPPRWIAVSRWRPTLAVSEYWLADSMKKAIEVYWFDRAAGAYRLEAIYRRGDRVTMPLLPEISVEVARVFA